MPDYVTLLGAEQVHNASRTMSSAADDMRTAANNLDGSLETFNRRMEDWLFRFESSVERLVTALEAKQGL